MGELERANMRVSDADRHQVAELLREAAGDGRLDLSELDERLEAAYAAKTYGDLVPITADLASTVTDVPVVGGPARDRAFAIMGGVERRGIWVVPERFDVFCMMGGAHLDLRQAQFSSPEVRLSVNTFMGGATILVNNTTHVVVRGTGIMGGYSAPRSGPETRIGPDSPVVRVGGVAIMGGVEVVRKGMPGEDTTPGWRRRD